jgi:hypothetical protein
VPREPKVTAATADTVASEYVIEGAEGGVIAATPEKSTVGSAELAGKALFTPYEYVGADGSAATVIVETVAATASVYPKLGASGGVGATAVGANALGFVAREANDGGVYVGAEPKASHVGGVTPAAAASEYVMVGRVGATGATCALNECVARSEMIVFRPLRINTRLAASTMTAGTNPLGKFSIVSLAPETIG